MLRAQLNGLAGIDYPLLRWDVLAAEVMADKLHRWEAGTADPYSGFAYAPTLGREVQGYLNVIPELSNISGAPELWPANPGGNATAFGWPGYDLIINFYDPDAPPDHMTRLMEGPNNTVAVTYYPIQDGFPVGILLPLAFAVAGFLLAPGAGVGAVVETGVSVGAGEVGTGVITAEMAASSEALFDAWAAQQAAAEAMVGLESFGGITASWEGYLTAASVAEAAGVAVESIAPEALTDLYANETAKLLQQQALAQSGFDLLPTTLPTIDLSTATTASSWFSPSTAREWLNTARTVTGTASAINSITGSRTPTRATSVRAPGQTYLPYQPGGNQVLVTQQPSSNTALWLAAAAGAAALFLR